jgi:hypothetical protein
MELLLELMELSAEYLLTTPFAIPAAAFAFSGGLYALLLSFTKPGDEE